MTRDYTTLSLVRAGIDIDRQPVVYMNEDCCQCLTGGVAARSPIRLSVAAKPVVAAPESITHPDGRALHPAAAGEECPVTTDHSPPEQRDPTVRAAGGHDARKHRRG